MYRVLCRDREFELSPSTVQKTTLPREGPVWLDRRPETMQMCFQFAQGYPLAIPNGPNAAEELLCLAADAMFLGLYDLASKVTAKISEEAKQNFFTPDPCPFSNYIPKIDPVPEPSPQPEPADHL
jgi:hypothetical protein